MWHLLTVLCIYLIWTLQNWLYRYTLCWGTIVTADTRTGGALVSQLVKLWGAWTSESGYNICAVARDVATDVVLRTARRWRPNSVSVANSAIASVARGTDACAGLSGGRTAVWACTAWSCYVAYSACGATVGVIGRADGHDIGRTASTWQGGSDRRITACKPSYNLCQNRFKIYILVLIDVMAPDKFSCTSAYQIVVFYI